MNDYYNPPPPDDPPTQEAEAPAEEVTYERVAAPFEYILSAVCEMLWRSGGVVDVHIDEHNYHASSKIEVWRSQDKKYLRFKVVQPATFDKTVSMEEHEAAAGASQMSLADVMKWGHLFNKGES